MADDVATGRPPTRARLNRENVLKAALEYVDDHGLGTLSMNKLGAELGIAGMSVYSHVASKDELLDGIVEVMWGELEPPTADGTTWPEAVYAYARSLRDMIYRHVAAAPLLNRATLPVSSLEYVDAYRQVLVGAGLTDRQAIQALRAVHGYALGFSLAEVSWWGDAAQHHCTDDLTMLRRATGMVPRDTSDHLVRLAVDFCYDNQADQFEAGLDLMVQGLLTRM
ncbi:MAG TPA: TetR/AcrR family transcriptional regulator C-terminal domain-containing protein [Pseudonocardiaceae bacterium]|nr:TetR/AcrR family transcriptional regulator C-terminal domain-containing protein [Pseudonocardiaceae bacterium]